MNAFPNLIFDSGPLITLATPKVDAKPIVEYVRPLLNIIVVETVAQETTSNLRHPNAVVIKALLDNGHIARVPVPTTAVDTLIDSYPKLGVDKGKGERDTIRLGVATQTRVVIDDQQAFFVAARFELNPVTLPDLLVELTRSRRLPKPLALRLVNAMTGRYVETSIQHTLYKLNEVSDDPGHPDNR
jgi:hypothetical protein